MIAVWVIAVALPGFNDLCTNIPYGPMALPPPSRAQDCVGAGLHDIEDLFGRDAGARVV